MSGIARKIAMLLLLPFLGSVAATACFSVFLARTSSVPAQLNVAGRQRMLSARIHEEVLEAGSRDRPPADGELADLTAAFETALAALERGGDVAGRQIAPLPDAMAAPLGALRREWNGIKPALLRAAGGRRDAGIDLDAATGRLLDRSERLALALEELARRLRWWMFWILASVTGFGLLVLGIGIWYARRHVVEPIRDLASAAARISEGDYAIRVAGCTGDELGSLAETLDAMAARICALVEAVELRRDEAQVRLAALESAGDAIVITDSEARIQYVNGAFSALGGFASDEVLGRTPKVIASGLTRPALYEDLWRTISAGRPWRGELINRHRDGSLYDVEVRIAPVCGHGRAPTHFVAVLRDVTERKRVAARMMEADRMIAFGTLAAGVGHEINNPLCYTIASLDFLAGALPAAIAAGRGPEPEGAPSAELEEALAAARDGASRIAAIVRDLKTFSRTDPAQLALLDVREVLESALKLTRNEIRHRAVVKREYGDVPHVNANAGKLSQVLVNLLINASQAIPEGASGAEIWMRTRRAGDRVIVEVEDTGPGIPADLLSRIFDPFFTTKPIGEGTGLGLAISRQAVADLGGTIVAESPEGRGAVFRITLPAAPPQVPPSCASAPGPGEASRRGRLLVVDDEELVCRAIARILGKDHEIATFTSAQEAETAIRDGERFDLLLCDLIMPETTGMDLHARLAAAEPDQAARMVFMTGGAFSPRAREFLASVSNPRIEKPFDSEGLRLLIRGLLGAVPERTDQVVPADPRPSSGMPARDRST